MTHKYDPLVVGMVAGGGDIFLNESVHWLIRLGSGVLVAILSGAALRLLDRLLKKVSK